MQNGEIQFLRTEAQTGLTFSKLALGSRQGEKIARNRANARKAYDTLLRFMPRDDANTELWEEIRAKLGELKRNLRQLGEDV